MGANLLWRFVWAFFGNRYTRWRGILPGGPGYLTALRGYTASFLSGEPQQFVGHNPLARVGISLLFLLLVIQLTTGLVIAGTDLFWPPFGHWFAQWIAAPGVDPAALQWVPLTWSTKRPTRRCARSANPSLRCMNLHFMPWSLSSCSTCLRSWSPNCMRVAASHLPCSRAAKFSRADRRTQLEME